MMFINEVDDLKYDSVTQKGVKDTYIQWLLNKDNCNVRNFAMRIFKVKPSGKIGLHSHDWEHEIFILSGKGEIGTSKKSFKVKENTAIYIEPNVEHWYNNIGNNDLIFLCLIPIKD
jgi:quercetin dioxygenase-like cupin family protein